MLCIYQKLLHIREHLYKSKGDKEQCYDKKDECSIMTEILSHKIRATQSKDFVDNAQKVQNLTEKMNTGKKILVIVEAE